MVNIFKCLEATKSQIRDVILDAKQDAEGYENVKPETFFSREKLNQNFFDILDNIGKYFWVRIALLRKV